MSPLKSNYIAHPYRLEDNSFSFKIMDENPIVNKKGKKIFHNYLTTGMKYCLFILLCLSALSGNTQDIDRLKFKADLLKSGEKAGEKFKILVGNVVFTQKNTKIYSDSAYFYDQRNFAEVFGHVRIKEGDSITITANKLEYDGDKKIAKLREDVVYRDPDMTLYTDYLDYNRMEHLAYYYDGGRLISDQSSITSDQGNYDNIAKFASFKDSVTLVMPDYTLTSDTLQYNTVTEVAYTKGPTKINMNDGTILNAMVGLEYNTNEKQSLFQVSEIETEDYILRGDELFFDDLKKFYTADSNVEMVAKEDNIIIYGDHGRYWREKGLTKVYGTPLMTKIVNEDTLYMSADTLVSIEDSIATKKRILAYNDVKIFKSNLQGIADSLSYHVSDSMLYFYNDPVLWSDENQISADSINVEIRNNRIDRMNTQINSFVVSVDTVGNFNQIKGRDMTAIFKDNKIDRVHVIGNGESIYYALEDDTVTIGMNRILCSNMLIRFKNSTVNKISFYTNPDARFIPPHEIQEPDTRLKGFAWREEERPEKEDVVKREITIPEIPGKINLTKRNFPEAGN